MEIEISNFQSIGHFKEEFNGFCAITGRSNLGKSSIIRAINFLLENNFNKSYIKHNSKSVSVKIDNIIRHRDTKQNYYEINGTKYNKVGANVPNELKNMGFTPFSFKDGEDNTLCVPQYKPLFLINETEFTQTKIFNSIFGVDIYEEAIKLMKKDRDNLNKNINSLKEINDTIKEETKGYTDRLSILSKIQNVKKTHTLLNTLLGHNDELNIYRQQMDVSTNKVSFINNAFTKIYQLQKLQDYLLTLNEYNSISDKIAFFKSKLDLTNKLNSAINKHNNLVTYEKTQKELSLLQEKIFRISNQLNILTKLKEAKEKLSDLILFDNNMLISNKIISKKDIMALIDMLLKLITLDKLVGINDNLKKEYNLVIDNYNSIKDIICPCCGQIIKGDKK